MPVFAFFAAGVSVVDGDGIGAAPADPVTLGIIAGLVPGKTVGVLGSTWLMQRFTRARLSDDLGWWDLLGLAQLAGIRFTVSLLVGGPAQRWSARAAACRTAAGDRPRRPASQSPVSGD